MLEDPPSLVVVMGLLESHRPVGFRHAGGQVADVRCACSDGWWSLTEHREHLAGRIVDGISMGGVDR